MDRLSALFVIVALTGCGLERESASPTATDAAPDNNRSGGDTTIPATTTDLSDPTPVITAATPVLTCPERTVVGELVVFELTGDHPQERSLTFEVRVSADDGRTFGPRGPKFEDVASGEVVSFRNNFTVWGPGRYEVQARSYDGTTWSPWSEPRTIVCTSKDASPEVPWLESPSLDSTEPPAADPVDTTAHSETPPPGPPWQRDFNFAQREALRTGKPIFIYFTKTY